MSMSSEALLSEKDGVAEFGGFEDDDGVLTEDVKVATLGEGIAPSFRFFLVH
jgi:hypothetical protein